MNRYIKPFVLLLTCFASIAVLTSMFSPVLEEKPLPLDPAVRTGKLSNGFTYFIRHNEAPKNRVVFYLANKVGSILENENQRGLAHFIEHMSFNGTKHFPKNELVDYLEKSGVRFGADLNAYTSFDETVYQLPLPADDPAILKNGIQIMRDWAQEAILDPVEIDKERGVVLEEKRLGMGASERIRQQVYPMLLNGSRYVDRMPIGLESVLTQFKPETLREFYFDWYRPDLQALIVVGDIDVDAMEKAIKAKFSDLKNPKHKKQRTKYRIPLTGKNQFLIVTDPEMTSTVMDITIKNIAPKMKTALDYRSAIIQNLFNEMLGQRYAELSRQGNPPFLKGSAGVTPLMGGLDSYSLSVVAKPSELERGVKAVWRESERLKRFGFTSTELERAKKAFQSQMDAGLKEKSKTPSESYVKEYVQYFLDEISSPGIEIENKLVHAQLPGITLAELNQLCKVYIKNTNRDIVVQAPEKDRKSLPAESQLLSWLNAVEKESLQPYQDVTVSKPLLTKAPVTGQIVKEETDPALNTTTLTLSNGLRVILKPTNFKNNEILFTGFAPGGTSAYPDADFQSAANAAGIITSFGAGNYDMTALQKLLSGKQLQVQPYIIDRTQGFHGATAPADLESALELLYAQFTEPRIDTAMFRGMIMQSRAALANRENDPGSVFQDSVSAVLSGYNVRGMGPSLQKLDQIKLDRVYAIYKERYSDASNFTFLFVGNFEVNAIKPLLQKYLGALPATHRHEEAKDLGIHIPSGQIEKRIHAGKEDKASVMLVFSGEYASNPENNLALSVVKELLTFRMVERLREAEGGAYAPSVDWSRERFPQSRYSMTVSFGCAPSNADKLIAAALQEVQKLKIDGATETDLQKFATEQFRQMELYEKENGFWINYLSGKIQNKEELNELFAVKDMIKKLTVKDTQEAAKRFLNEQNLIRLVWLPEKGS